MSSATAGRWPKGEGFADNTLTHRSNSGYDRNGGFLMAGERQVA